MRLVSRKFRRCSSRIRPTKSRPLMGVSSRCHTTSHNSEPVNALILLGLLALLLLLCLELLPRVRLSLAEHRSLEDPPRWARRLARLVPYYEYDEQRFFCADDAPPDVAAPRRAAF